MAKDQALQSTITHHVSSHYIIPVLSHLHKFSHYVPLYIPSGKLTSLWKITIFNGKIHYKLSFSIAMLVYQRVTICNYIYIIYIYIAYIYTVYIYIYYIMYINTSKYHQLTPKKSPSRHIVESSRRLLRHPHGSHQPQDFDHTQDTHGAHHLERSGTKGQAPKKTVW